MDNWANHKVKTLEDIKAIDEEFKKKMKHLNAKEIIAIWFAVVAAIVSITALWMPPVGIIDETVLVLVGQFLLFIATLTGVDGALTRFHEMRQKSPPADAT